MDSQDYFRKAEKNTKTYHTVVIILLIIVIGVMAFAGAQVYKLNNDNHKTSVQILNTILNDIRNTNLNNELNLKCIIDQTYIPPPQKTKTQADAALNYCIQSTNKPVKGN